MAKKKSFKQQSYKKIKQALYAQYAFFLKS